MPAPSPSETPTQTPAPPVSCWVGLDWADQKHCVSVRTGPGGPGQRHFVEQKPAALDGFFSQLRAQHPQGRIAVGLEQSRGPVLYALLKYDYLVIYPVNPRTLADYRSAFKVSGAKGDPQDADLLGELVALHADRLRPLETEEPCTRQLRLLTEHRRDFVDERTRWSNRLTATLKAYYPLALELVGEHLTDPLGLDFLDRWPNLAALKKAKPETLRQFFQEHNGRSKTLIAERLAAVAQAKPLTEDLALIQPHELEAGATLAQLKVLVQTIQQYDQRIQELFAQHSEASLFARLPGAGPVLAPRLAAAFGTLRANYPTPQDLLCFTGVAPVQKQSGTQRVVQFRRARPLFLHQTMVEFARCSLGQCRWAKLFYQDAIDKGQSRWTALRKLAFKWLRILWRCWQDRKAYDETQYLRRLQAHGVQLYASLYAALPAEK